MAAPSWYIELRGLALGGRIDLPPLVIVLGWAEARGITEAQLESAAEMIVAKVGWDAQRQRFTTHTNGRLTSYADLWALLRNWARREKDQRPAGSRY